MDQDSEKGKKRQKKSPHAKGPDNKKSKTSKDGSGSSEPEFSYLRFKFLLRSQDTVGKALQTFLDVSMGAGEDSDTESDDVQRLALLESYLKSSPECTEVLDLLSQKLSPQDSSLLFSWLKFVLQTCPRVTENFEKVQQHIVSAILKHIQVVLHCLRKSNAAAVKPALMLLIAITSLNTRFAQMLHFQIDFSNAYWLPVWTDALGWRNRKDEADVRACATALFMKLLQADDDSITTSLVQQKSLLQEILQEMMYDPSDYVVANLKTFHTYVVLNTSISKTAKLQLFNTTVISKLLKLYHWPGPEQWKPNSKHKDKQNKNTPAVDQKQEYTPEQREVAERLHPMLMDLLADHSLGICFQDKSLGLSSSNKEKNAKGGKRVKVSNEAVSQVLLRMVTCYTSPLAYRLVLAILQACPEKVPSYLKDLHSHLTPRPVDSWIACLHFFLKIVENHQWPEAAAEEAEGDVLPEERVTQILQYLFPPDRIFDSLRDGLKSECGTVRHLCLQALNRIYVRGQHYLSMSRQTLGDKAPLTLAIEGFVSKILFNSQVLQSLLNKLVVKDKEGSSPKSPKAGKDKATKTDSIADGFSVAIARELYRGTDLPLPQVMRAQHLVEILHSYSLQPQHLTEGSVDCIPTLLKLVTSMCSLQDSSSTLDGEDDGEAGQRSLESLPALYLLQALSKCDVRSLSLFGKAGPKSDLRQSLMYCLIHMMQHQSGDHKQTAQMFIVKLLSGTGLFEGQERELGVWIHHLADSESALEEVVLFFVGLLRQYVPNPYPAIDRLVEKVEEDPDAQSLSNSRLEFSPLVMFALSGDFSSNKKVRKYLSQVLIDILHSLHDPTPFSRLVHSMSRDSLDPDVVQYLTFHTSEEECWSDSIRKRMQKKLRVQNIAASLKHPGLGVMKKALKDQGEASKLVGKLSSGDCLPLIQQTLRHLDELVHATEKEEKEEEHKKAADVCLDILEAACQHLAKSTDSESDRTSKLTTKDATPSTSMDVDSDGDNVNLSNKDSNGTGKEKKSKKQAKKSKELAYDLESSSDEDDEMKEEGDSEDDEEEETSEDDEDKTKADSSSFGNKGFASEVSLPDKYCGPLPKNLGTTDSALTGTSGLQTDWLQEVLVVILKHPVIQNWLFEDGFLQHSHVRQFMFRRLCGIVKELMQHRNCSSSLNINSFCDVAAKCTWLIEHATLSIVKGNLKSPAKTKSPKTPSKQKPSDVGMIPASVQTSLCLCLDSLLSVGDERSKLKALLEIVKAKPENFLTDSSAPSDLGKIVIGLASAVSKTTVVSVFKNNAGSITDSSASNLDDLRTSLKGLLGLAATIKNSEVENLALTFVQNFPELSSACSLETFDLLFTRAVSEASPSLQSLVESLMGRNSECLAVCQQRLKKWRKKKNAAQEYAAIMLLYVGLVMKKEDTTAEKDEGVMAIAESVHQTLEGSQLDSENVKPAFLLLVCHLVNLDLIENAMMQKLIDKILSLLKAKRSGGFHEAHVQLLAAILRQQSLTACTLRNPAAETTRSADADMMDDLERRWCCFEETAGKVLVCLLRHLMANPVTKNEDKGQVLLVQLCHELLELAIPPEAKSNIASLWSELVSTFLKFHYKDTRFLSLMRRLVEKAFTEGQKSSKSNDDGKEDDNDDNEDDADNTEKAATDTSAMEVDGESSESSSDDDDNDNSALKDDSEHASKSRKLPSPAQRKGPYNQTKKAPTWQRKPLHTIMSEVAKQRGVSKSADVARKCVALFGQENSKPFETDTEEIVCSWTNPQVAHSKTFFLWPGQKAGVTRRSNLTLSSESSSETLLDACRGCVRHGDFLAVMQGGELSAMRCELVRFLASLVRLEISCVSVLPLKTFVAAYGATMSETDQNLLYLMFACDHYADEKLQFGLWGERVVKQLAMKQYIGKSLKNATTFHDIMEEIDPAVMMESVLHFSLMRTVEFDQMECAVKPERLMSKVKVYDPRFLLQVFLHFLGPEHYVDLRSFITRNCLGFTFAALSSHDRLMRRLAYSVLAAFKTQVEGVQRWRSRVLLLHILEALERGKTDECQKLPCTITIFLARATELFLKPESEMYIPIFNFLTLKPALDFGNVPEFYCLFNSPSLKERVWILRLLHQGLRETGDHRLLQKRYAYKLISCYANSSLSDTPTRVESLKVLVKAASIATVARDLVVKHGLLAWLVTFIRNDFCDLAEMRGLVCQLLHNVCYTTEFGRRQLWWFSLARMTRYCWLQTPLLACVHLLMDRYGSADVENRERLQEILDHPHFKSSHAPLTFTVPAENES